jgi:hypothetical protein
MPVNWRLHVLEERLKREFGTVFDIETVDLYGVSPLEQSAAIDAMIETRGDFPIVLVGGVVACVSDIDADAIADQLGKTNECLRCRPPESRE